MAGRRTLIVQVKPRSARSGLEQRPDGTLVARLHAPPVDGRANAELVALLAAHFGCPKSAVRIESGAGSRTKRVSVPDPRD